MNKIKKYDAVKAMRDEREKLSEKYWKRTDILKSDMQSIHKKYGFMKKAGALETLK